MSFNGSAIAAAAAILLGVVSTRSAAQADSAGAAELPGAIAVQVADTGLNPLPAKVIIRELGIDFRLPAEGSVLFVSVPDGAYLLEVRHDGHASHSTILRVRGDTVRAEFTLSRADGAPATPATPTTPGHGGIAAARLRSFIEQHTTMTSATFLTRNEIERRRPRTVSTLLGRLRAVSVEHGPRGRTIVRSTDATGPTCTDGMLVLVDGSPLAEGREPRTESRPQAHWRLAAATAVDDEAPALKWVGPSGGDLVRVARHAPTPSGPAAGHEPRVTDIDRVRVSSIVAIEVYTTPWVAPSEFKTLDRGCGIVLIWTVDA